MLLCWFLGGLNNVILNCYLFDTSYVHGLHPFALLMNVFTYPKSCKISVGMEGFLHKEAQRGGRECYCCCQVCGTMLTD